MKILIYDDAAVFGGQQVMGVRATASLLAHGEDVSFIYFQGSARLEAELHALRARYPQMELIPVQVRSKRLQAVRLFFDIPDLIKVVGIIKKIKPELFLAIQGDIEIGSIGLLAARLAGVNLISYVPFSHTARKKGVKFAGVRDLISRFLYKLPNAFITSANAVAHDLSVRSGRPVCVVRDCIKDMPVDSVKRSKADLRSSLGLPQDKFIAAVVARVVFKHKGQDFLVEVAKQYASDLADVVFLIVGDGPDEVLLRSRVRDAGLDSMFSFITWCDGIADVLDAIDLLLMPSVFEGVPLTMLEAMQRRCPILASRVDGMKEVLPADMLYLPSDAKDFMLKLNKFSGGRLDHLESLLIDNERLQKNSFSIDVFHQSYHPALVKLIGEFK